MVIVKFLRTVFYRTPLVAASESPTIAQQSQLGCLFYDFTPPSAFDFDQKLTQNVAQIIFLLPSDKAISYLLELIEHVLPISEYVLEKH